MAPAAPRPPGPTAGITASDGVSQCRQWPVQPRCARAARPRRRRTALSSRLDWAAARSRSRDAARGRGTPIRGGRKWQSGPNSRWPHYQADIERTVRRAQSSTYNSSVRSNGLPTAVTLSLNDSRTPVAVADRQQLSKFAPGKGSGFKLGRRAPSQEVPAWARTLVAVRVQAVNGGAADTWWLVLTVRVLGAARRVWAKSRNSHVWTGPASLRSARRPCQAGRPTARLTRTRSTSCSTRWVGALLARSTRGASRHRTPRPLASPAVATGQPALLLMPRCCPALHTPALRFSAQYGQADRRDGGNQAD